MAPNEIAPYETRTSSSSASGTVASRVTRPTLRLQHVLALALAAAAAIVAVPSAAGLGFNDTPCIESGPSGVRVCPSGTVDTPYSLQITARAGCEPYHTFRLLSGALPPGLEISSSGLISGTPTTAGTYLFYLEVADIGPDEGGPEWCTVVKRSEREFSIAIGAGLAITTTSAPAGTTGSPYSLALAAAAKLGPETFASLPAAPTWSVEGALPPGLALNAETGLIAGTPTADGTYTFTVRASLPDGRSATRTLAIEVRTALAIVPPEEIPPAEVGVPVRVQLGATGGRPGYTWSLSSGSLPDGVALTAAGRIAGRPLVPGTFRFTATVTDAGGQSASYSGVLRVVPRLAIVRPLALRPVVVGRFLRLRVVTTGGVAPTTWTLMGALPPGLRFDAATVTLSGIPRAPGRFRVTLLATDALGVKAKRSYLLVVLAAKS